jgi:hypothetical protein
MERAYCHDIFGLSDYHQERTSPPYSERKNNPRQLQQQEAVQTITVACDVARQEPYRACMGLYWPKN